MTLDNYLKLSARVNLAEDLGQLPRPRTATPPRPTHYADGTEVPEADPFALPVATWVFPFRSEDVDSYAAAYSKAFDVLTKLSDLHPGIMVSQSVWRRLPGGLLPAVGEPSRETRDGESPASPADRIIEALGGR